MAAKGEETSQRKRLSIPTADESSIHWWESQHDPGLSVRMLIRAEIERNGFVDVAYRPVAQLPRRGRPPGQSEPVGEAGPEQDLPASAPESAPAVAAAPAPAAQSVAAGGFDPIDAIMNS